ncbi:hypothetical protein Taro_020367 [Colocasia esculenta]|uniref:aldehyde oxygenase (deformylating) n=1 Tax=Colocasia esculenta TaxID=4460 RepID=A0A843V249_COLES|nr:hypothetical protein [Colocasia esculenta]
MKQRSAALTFSVLVSTWVSSATWWGICFQKEKFSFTSARVHVRFSGLGSTNLRALSDIQSTVSPSYTSAGLYVSGVRGSAQAVHIPNIFTPSDSGGGEGEKEEEEEVQRRSEAWWRQRYRGKGGDGGQDDKAGPALLPSLLRYSWQLTVGVLIMDAWGYFWHRLTHENRFLYKHVHSPHHRLVVPYAYGSQYQHPIDFFMADGLSSVLATLATGMSSRTATVFLALLTLKAVDDHCGLWLPGSPTSRLCNNVAMHAVHHQHHGIKSNYSVYFLVTWDKLLGTYVPYSVEERDGGGYQLRSGTTTKDL